MFLNMVAEHGCDTPWRAPRERISEKICEQVVDVQLPQVVEQVLGGPKIPSRDRILQGTRERVLDVPVPEMVEQLVKLPKTVSQNRTQQQTEEQVINAPVPQVVEELVEVSKVLSEQGATAFRDRSLNPVSETQEKTQQVANTHAQHVVNTVKSGEAQDHQADNAETRHPGEDQPDDQAH